MINETESREPSSGLQEELRTVSKELTRAIKKLGRQLQLLEDNSRLKLLLVRTILASNGQAVLQRGNNDLIEEVLDELITVAWTDDKNNSVCELLYNGQTIRTIEDIQQVAAAEKERKQLASLR